MFVDVPQNFVDCLRVFINFVDFHNFSVKHAFSLTFNDDPMLRVFLLKKCNGFL